MENNLNPSHLTWKKRKQLEDELKKTVPSIEELLCLQLLGYTSQDIFRFYPFFSTELYFAILFPKRTDYYSKQLKKIFAHAQLRLEQAKQILEKEKQAGITIVPYYAKNYPQHLLNDLRRDTPLLIHTLGNNNLLYPKNKTAIIGARRANQEGLDVAYRLAQKFSAKGHIIVSGLALGCDSAAHRGCLDSGGKTIAIVGSGLDRTHPKANKFLQDEIVRNGGLILSEQPFGVKASPARLVARCRIQVGISSKIIVAQCPILSGTMYTAHFAQKYGKHCDQIYAVKYDTYDELNSGNQFLLEQNIAIPIRP